MANKGLGRGLGSLFGDAGQEFDNAAAPRHRQGIELPESGTRVEGAEQISLDKIFSNPDQPRKRFDAETLGELAASISEHGVIQPVILNKSGARYMLIAGERRWRAAKMAGLTEIPAVVKNYTPKEIKEISLIENLQREDLNAIEAAAAVRRLMAEHKYTQETVAGRIGKSRPYVANLLRLLELPQEVQALVAENRLSAGHARALAGKDRALQVKLARDAADGKMSVRDMEKAVRRQDKAAGAQKQPPAAFKLTTELKELKTAMQRVFATKVEIFGGENKGKIFIEYYSRDDIDRIADIIAELSR